jgi:hypothetical protein
VFAYYPDILLVPEAGGFEVGALVSILVRVVVALWLMTSAFSMFDALPLKPPEAALRLVLVVVVLLTDPLIHWPAFAAAIGLITFNYRRAYLGRLATAA